MEEDQAQEAAQELVRALSGDDEQQDHWQPPSIMRRGSWDDAEESAAAMDEYKDAEEELEDEDMPAAEFPVSFELKPCGHLFKTCVSDS